jgi:hypothetical protein
MPHDTRMRYASMVLDARSFVRKQAMGLKLTARESQRLSRMPEDVQHAIRACKPMSSRYWSSCLDNPQKRPCPLHTDLPKHAWGFKAVMEAIARHAGFGRRPCMCGRRISPRERCNDRAYGDRKSTAPRALRIVRMGRRPVPMNDRSGWQDKSDVTGGHAARNGRNRTSSSDDPRTRPVLTRAVVSSLRRQTYRRGLVGCSRRGSDGGADLVSSANLIWLSRTTRSSPSSPLRTRY